jgi:hypothetical protein
MKKIYLTLSAIALAISSIAQQSFVNAGTTAATKQKAILTPKTKARVLAPIKNGGLFGVNTATANFQGRFDPAYALPFARGFTLGFVGTEEYKTYVDPLFCDSTTSSSFSTTDKIGQHLLGWNFDPKSIIYESDINGLTYAPLLDNTQPYFLDTVWIAGSYKRLPGGAGAPDDTLIVLVSYGDTTSTNWARWNYSNATLAAFGQRCTPKFNSNASDGDQMSFVGTNTLKIKHVLTKADSTYMADISDYLPIVIGGTGGLLIPADNNINVSYSFNSAGTHTLGAVSWPSSTPLDIQTTSGWAAYTWYQEVPAVAAFADVTQGYDDFGTGKNSSTYVLKSNRYKQQPTSLFNTVCRTGFYWGYWMDFSIHYDVTTKVNELSKNNSILGQNMPNPFTTGSAVKYTLAKDANAATFTVTDVTGRIISSEKVGTSSGNHTVNLGAYAAGVYYYSLNVDGITTTKKMIAQ